LQEAALGANRPPVVQEYLQRAPHRNPAPDQKTFANDFAETALAEIAGNGVANRNGRCEKYKGDDEADAATPEQFSKFPPRRHDSLAEVLVNRFPQDRRFVGAPRRAVKVDDQRPGSVRWQISRPADDEFLGAGVEVTLTERGRIDRVEELSQLCDPDLDDLAVLRESVPCGRPRFRHLSS
jgi:hypothetical protein